MLKQVSESLLAPTGVELSHLSQVLDHFSSRQIDYADLYFQLSQDESWVAFISTAVLACVLFQARKRALPMLTKSV